MMWILKICCAHPHKAQPFSKFKTGFWEQTPWAHDFNSIMERLTISKLASCLLSPSLIFFGNIGPLGTSCLFTPQHLKPLKPAKNQQNKGNICARSAAIKHTSYLEIWTSKTKPLQPILTHAATKNYNKQSIQLNNKMQVKSQTAWAHHGNRWENTTCILLHSGFKCQTAWAHCKRTTFYEIGRLNPATK